MKRLKSEELSKLSEDELHSRLNDLRSELVTLRSKAARGILKKQLGEIKTVRRNVARVMTVVSAVHNEKRVSSFNQKEKQEATSKTTNTSSEK